MMKRSIIMIIDDEVSNIEILSAALEDDYDVCFATSAEEAYDVLRNVIPDLVLLDVIMPGASGYEVCRHIKSDPLLADIPIIFTTALDAEDAQLVGLERRWRCRKHCSAFWAKLQILPKSRLAPRAYDDHDLPNMGRHPTIDDAAASL